MKYCKKCGNELTVERAFGTREDNMTRCNSNGGIK